MASLYTRTYNFDEHTIIIGAEIKAELNAIQSAFLVLDSSLTVQVAAAAISASAAAASAITAINSPGTNATSSSLLSISIAPKTLTVQPGKSLVAGMSVKIASAVSPSQWMHGDITAYDPVTGVLTVNVTLINGTGSFNSWVVSLSAPYALASPVPSADTMRVTRRARLGFINTI